MRLRRPVYPWYWHLLPAWLDTALGVTRRCRRELRIREHEERLRVEGFRAAWPEPARSASNRVLAEELVRCEDMRRAAAERDEAFRKEWP